MTPVNDFLRNFEELYGIVLRGCLTPVFSSMANQRSKSKKVLSVPMDEKLLADIEAEAAKRGVNRVALVNEILSSGLLRAGRLPKRKPDDE